MKKVAFIDRDGALIWEPPETFQIDSLKKLRILPNAFAGLRALREEGFTLVMVSNQDGVGTASFPREDFEIPHTEMLRQLREEGIVFDEVFVCPHLAADNCECRKPKTGMVKDFLQANAIDFANSLMIGDRESDRLFAANVGVRFVKAQTNGPFPRFAGLKRETKETTIDAFANLDGTGTAKISTGIGFFDHMLELLTKHALMDLSLTTQGDLQVDEHHTVEDTGLVLGQVLAKALGEKRGIERFGFLLPMDEALAEVALDLSGRPVFVFAGSFRREYVGSMPTELIAHFFQSLAQGLRCTLHMTIRRGENEHHIIEVLFKGLGRTFRQAFAYNPRETGIPSTKGSL